MPVELIIVIKAMHPGARKVCRRMLRIRGEIPVAEEYHGTGAGKKAAEEA